MIRADLLHELQAVVAEVTERDREERRKRVRSAFGMAKDAPVPADYLKPEQIPSYQITVQTSEYLTLQIRAAAAVLLAKHLNNADVSKILEVG